MKSMETLQSTVESSIRECESHLQKMESAFDHIKPVLPFNSRNFPVTDELTTAYIDQFLFRFTKMQDSIAARLCPGLYHLMENDIQSNDCGTSRLSMKG